jgi:hypothetical protein
MRALRSGLGCACLLLLAIFLETATTSENGVSTKKRPGMVSSQLRRGPLVEMGSFRIWTRMGCRLDTT